MNYAELFAVFATIILSLLAIFQIALVAGAPLGNYAWGGAHKKLPKKLRISSLLSILLYAIFIIFILSKAGLIQVIQNDTIASIGVWVMFSYFALGIVMNALSRSKPERMVMTPVATLLAISYLAVAVLA